MGTHRYNRERCAEIILAKIAAGASLVATCEADDTLPTDSGFLNWVSEDAALAERYARAREIQHQRLADEIIEIADNEDGDPQRDRLRVDTRKWFLSKVLPKVYGERGATVNVDARQQSVTVFDREGMLAALKDPKFRRAALDAPDVGSNGHEKSNGVG